MVRDGIGDQNDTGSIVPKKDPRTKCFTKKTIAESYRGKGSGFRVQGSRFSRFYRFNGGGAAHFVILSGGKCRM